MPSTWCPVWIFLIRAISAGVATLGSTSAWAHVNPLNVPPVVWVMPLSFEPGHQDDRVSCMTALLGTNVPTPIA
jgi:hypothetical protein